MSITKINTKENIFGDNIAFVEEWDFSQANTSEENRILAITQVASICYQSPKALGSETLYNRLMAESMGLPSSSFEFVPVLLDFKNPTHMELLQKEYSNVKKFGELVEDGKYLLTNYRAIVYDFENDKDGYSFDIRQIYNTLDEAEIIRKNFHVFLYKVDLPTRSQMVRHRINWQELSRRYVSGKRVPFDFYISEKMIPITTGDYDTQKIIDLCVEHYMNAIDAGVKPQEARRIIPQAAYSQIWGAFMPTQLANYFKLRLDEHAQWEIRKTAEAMKELIQKPLKQEDTL
ncbi:MAG: FAD-dependent thymidylate synthase [Sulfuricurvum sp.]|uniref:FAD-dependent thymidylate synthase n=1 Tax=Sulfuricurvum sp. TaxID=2025608 RepID=UPI00261F0554|nr:FAD-dependent thymidylate synthase [Sulfuricurvum sp.]MDD2369461.1 FAD-dependent thymidylate synthase [Sulfuricurvum sp.]MDD2951391.1 FAD-dependent thymidylate synthase [Sulfuricurvum sp.]MDD5117750.1 FAD-dependent thymidylate synthase [Sulfuricurvum sp.]